MKKFLLSILCCLLCFISGNAEVTTVVDKLTLATTGVTGTAYKSWSGKTLNSSAVYDGQSAGDKESIQLRSNNSNSGVITTTSGGKVKKIIVEWNSGTSSGRTLNVYGKNSAYNSPTDLYSSKTSGDLLGTIVCGTSTELEIKSDYTYIGLRSASGAMYLTSISIEWEIESSSGGEVQKPLMPKLPEGGEFFDSKEIEITCDTEDVDIYYTTDGNVPDDQSNKYDGSFNITETMTINAIAIKDGVSSSVSTEKYTRVAKSPEIIVDGEGTIESPYIVTIKPAEGTTVLYTLNGKEPTEKSDTYLETLTIKADVTLQVKAYDEDGYASPLIKKEFTLKSSESSSDAVEKAGLVKDVTKLKAGDQVVVVALDSNYALSTTQNKNNRGQVAITKKDNNNVVELNENVQKLTLEEGTKSGTFAFHTESGYLYAASSSSNYLKTQTTKSDNSSWSISISEDGKATIKASGTNTRNLLKYNKQSSLFSCYASGQQDICLYKVETSSIEEYDLEVSAARWATLFLGYNAIIPDNVTCYVISEVGDSDVTLKEVYGTLPANTGVIVEADEGEYTFAVSTDEATVVSNLEGTIKNQYITNEAYVLGLDEYGVVGLYKAKMNGGVFLNNANKAYLPVSPVSSSAQAANGFKFRFETTGIEGVSAVKGEKVIFDLAGRKLNDMSAPGIYIVNGKKVMVK